VLAAWGRQYAAILSNVLGRNFREVDPDCLLGGTAGLAQVLHYPSQHLALLVVGPSAADVTSNPYLIRRRQSAGEVVTVRRDVVEDVLDEMGWRAGFLIVRGGDTADFFSFLARRPPPASSTANIGRHPILLSVLM